MIMVDNDILCCFEQRHHYLSPVAFSGSATERGKGQAEFSQDSALQSIDKPEEWNVTGMSTLTY